MRRQDIGVKLNRIDNAIYDIWDRAFFTAIAGIKLESHIMNNVSKPNVMPQVEFTQRQIDWLNSQYPEKLTTANATDAELRHSAGQRSVILLIHTRLQKQ